MKQLHEVREQYGGVYVTCFNDGLLVPWKPLDVGDYIRYTHDYNRALYISSRIEDEIFRKCVVDPGIVRQMPFLKAGIVSTVVLNIWEHSGPASIPGFNQDLESAREVLYADGTRAIHDLVQTITMAFPYKPEEIYAMDYETFLLRLAQAEKKLLFLRAIKEPIVMQDTRQLSPAQASLQQFAEQQAAQVEQKPRVDAKRLWDQQQGLIPPDEPEHPMDGPAKRMWDIHQRQMAKKEQKKVPLQQTGYQWWKVSPVLEAKQKHNINFRTEAAEAEVLGATGHEKADAYIERVKMLEDTLPFYQDLIQELAKRQQKSG